MQLDNINNIFKMKSSTGGSIGWVLRRIIQDEKKWSQGYGHKMVKSYIYIIQTNRSVDYRVFGAVGDVDKESLKHEHLLLSHPSVCKVEANGSSRIVNFIRGLHRVLFFVTHSIPTKRVL